MANKLELTWVGKEERIRVEPRLLIEDKTLSNTAQNPKTENMLIHGDNLLALKALEPQFAGKVKCIYIDPPYNTGSAFDPDQIQCHAKPHWSQRPKEKSATVIPSLKC